MGSFDRIAAPPEVRRWQEPPAASLSPEESDAPPPSAGARKDPFAGIWLLDGIPEPYLAQLAAVAREEHYVAGETVFRQGDEANGLYLVNAGRVRVITPIHGGSVSLSTVGPGECFGEMGVIDGAPRSATVTTTTLCVLQFVPTDPILDLMEQVPLLSMRMLVLLSHRIRHADKLITELAAKVSRSEMPPEMREF